MMRFHLVYIGILLMCLQVMASEEAATWIIDNPVETDFAEDARPVATSPAFSPTADPLSDADASQPEGGLNSIVVFTSAGHGFTGDTSAGWVTGRGLLYGVVEDMGNIDQMNYFADYCFRAGATVVPMRPLGNQTNEVVVDNVSASVSWGGVWQDSLSTVYYGGASEVPYRYAYINATGTTSWAVYRPTIPVAGRYPVYAWTRSGSDRVRQLYRIYHAGGITDVRVNHRRVGLGWVWLGTYYFEAGTNGSVNISNFAPGEDSAKVVIADAIRFGNGMGDVNRGYGLSGLERELEASRYWIQRMTGQGMSSSLYDSVSLDDVSDNVGAPARMAAEMNREADGTFWDRIYLGFHSNADGGAGTARGPMGLWDNRGTTTKQNRQKDFGTLVADRIHAALTYGQNGPWFIDGYANNSANLYGSAYGELYGTMNDEMNSTIIETLFHNNSSDANLLKDPSARRVMAMASYHAIVAHLATNNPSVSPVKLPDPPGHVRAMQTGISELTVAWSAPVVVAAGGDAATGYILYRSTNGLGYGHPIRVQGGATTSVTVTGAVAGQVYFFQVCATNAGGESLPAKVVGVRPDPSGWSEHLVVNGFDRNDRNLSPSRYFAFNLNGNVTRVLQEKINAGDYIVPHGEALAASGAAFASCAGEAVADGFVGLSNYHGVFWQLGRESTADQTFSAVEQGLVEAYLSRGGRLWASGTEIAWDLGRAAAPSSSKAFIAGVLRTGYLADDAGTGAARGATGGIFDGLGAVDFDYAGTGRLYKASYPDVLAITGTPASTVALVYGTSPGGSQAAAVAYDADYKLIVLGFPFESIFSATQRDDLMARALTFFGLPPKADRDGDGLPDWWEHLHFADPVFAQPDVDEDHDGLSNREEFVIGSDPDDAASGFAMVASSYLEGSGWSIGWPSYSGRIYAVWVSKELTGTYSQVVSNLIATPPLNVVTGQLLPEIERSFFRVQARRNL